MGVVEWEVRRDLRQDQDRVLDVHVFGRLEAFGEALLGGMEHSPRQSTGNNKEGNQARRHTWTMYPCHLRRAAWSSACS